MRLRTVLGAALVVSMLLAGVADAALVAHWKFDNPSPYADASGNGHTARGVGTGISFVNDGVSGDSFHTTTANKAVVDGANALGTNVSEMTISFWARNHTTNWDNFVAISGDAFKFQSDNTGRVRIFSSLAGAPGMTTLSPDPLVNDSVWSHIALAASAATNTAKLYIDDTEVASGTWSPSASIDNFSIGGSYGEGARNIDAHIDDVQVYDTALDADDVGWLYDNPGQAIPEPATMTLLVLGGAALLRRRRK